MSCMNKKKRNLFTTFGGWTGVQPFPGKLGSVIHDGALGRLGKP